jgi:hypothetical protein
MPEIIECKFSLFDEGRTYTGHHRKYILENAKAICYAPITREKIALREAVGFFGHGRRELAGKVKIPEVMAVKLPNGASVITENVPACVTVCFEISDEGVVTHRQEILDTAPGQVVSALNKSKVGGFSWACGGSDGGSMGATRLTSFEGCDYVIDPGFSANRGYVLESAGDAPTTDMILESISAAAGVDRSGAEAAFQLWITTGIFEAAMLRDQLEQAAIFEDALRVQIEEKGLLLESAHLTITAAQGAEKRRQELITECAGKSLVMVPGHVMEAMTRMSSEEDIQTVSAYFESAGRVDLSSLPVGSNRGGKTIIRQHGAPYRQEAEYGSAASAAELNTLVFK